MGSEMCIRDSPSRASPTPRQRHEQARAVLLRTMQCSLDIWLRLCTALRTSLACVAGFWLLILSDQQALPDGFTGICAIVFDSTAGSWGQSLLNSRMMVRGLTVSCALATCLANLLAALRRWQGDDIMPVALPLAVALHAFILGWTPWFPHSLISLPLALGFITLAMGNHLDPWFGTVSYTHLTLPTICSV